MGVEEDSLAEGAEEVGVVVADALAFLLEKERPVKKTSLNSEMEMNSISEFD